VWIRNESDVQDVWNLVRCGDNVPLWCHGVHVPSKSKTVMKPKNKKRRKRVSVLDAKNDRVEEVVTNLRQKHGTRYTTVQYRLWAEMVDVGTHK